MAFLVAGAVRLAVKVGTKVAGKVAKEVVGKTLTTALKKGVEGLAEGGFKSALKAGTDVLKKLGPDAIKAAIKTGDVSILKKVFSAFKDAGGKDALGNGLINFAEHGGIGGIAKLMSRSAFGVAIPGIDKLAEKLLKPKVVTGALDTISGL